MIKRVWWALALFFLASHGHAQNGLNIRVASDFIERELSTVLEAELGSKFDGVSVTRKDANTSRITVKIDGPVFFNVKASVDVGFSCWWRDPDIRVIYRSHSFSVSAVPDFITRLFTRSFINSEIIASYTRALQAKLPDAFTECPRFLIESNGDITLNWQQGTQCSNGATRHAACGYNQWGDGIEHLCVNGYWEIDSHMCESCADSSHPSCPRRQPGGGGNGRLPIDP